MSERILLDPPERKAEAPEPEPKAPPPVKSTPEPPQETPEPASKEAEGEGEAGEAEKPAPEDTAKKMRDYQERIDALTREKWEARRDADARAQRLAELERPPPQPGQQADPVEVAKQQLRMEQARRDFDTACNKTFSAGKAEYPDFDAAVTALQAVGAGQRYDFLGAITHLPEGHKVYRALASDLDNAARVLALPPMQMAVELARLEAKLAGSSQEPAPKSLAPAQMAHLGAPVSNAPEPIRPIGGGSRAVPSLEKMSMAEFIKARDKEEAERRRM
jgi:hypothetical protein